MSHVYVRALTLCCFYSSISTQTFRKALTASADSCAEIKSAPSVTSLILAEFGKRWRKAMLGVCVCPCVLLYLPVTCVCVFNAFCSPKFWRILTIFTSENLFSSLPSTHRSCACLLCLFTKRKKMHDCVLGIKRNRAYKGRFSCDSLDQCSSQIQHC